MTDRATCGCQPACLIRVGPAAAAAAKTAEPFDGVLGRAPANPRMALAPHQGTRFALPGA